jgi:hypothetical protein
MLCMFGPQIGLVEFWNGNASEQIRSSGKNRSPLIPKHNEMLDGMATCIRSLKWDAVLGLDIEKKTSKYSEKN